MEQLEHILPHVNATLNTIATVLLVIGYVLIKRAQKFPDRRESLEAAHKWTMLSCFAVSTAFLATYLFYNLIVMEGMRKKFIVDDRAVRNV